MNLINRLEREGATITREVSEETEEVAEEAAPSEEIEIAIGGIIEAAKHDTVVEAKTTARANGMSIIQRQCVNCDFACAGKHYDVDGDQLRVIKSECAMLNRNPGHDAYYNWSE